jgi:hypothetical protein
MNKLALVTATLILPVLAYADKGKDRDHSPGPPPRHVPVVPETNPGWVLAPFLGIVLLFSARKLFRSTVTE